MGVQPMLTKSEDDDGQPSTSTVTTIGVGAAEQKRPKAREANAERAKERMTNERMECGERER